MIDPGLYIAFAATVAILALTPGPNLALIVANSVAHGPRYGLVTIAGTSSAMIVQLGLTALGMTGLMGTLGGLFEWFRWIGVVYLVYLGIVQWRAIVIDLSGTPPEAKSASAIFGRGFFISLTNPKTLLFYGAFFPQFVDPAKEIGPQVAILSATFLALICMIDTGWAFAAGRARGILSAHGRLRNRISGGLLIGAGIGLAFARNK